MDDKHKLHHLIEHWIEHNEGHLGSYEEWALKAREWDSPQLTEALEGIARKTREIAGLLDEAARACK